MKIEITTEDRPLDIGWLKFLLGLPQPEDDEERAGFNQADTNATLGSLRRVFQTEGLYAVREVKAPEPKQAKKDEVLFLKKDEPMTVIEPKVADGE